MLNKKKATPSPPEVVSAGCSRIKSYLSLCQPSPIPPSKDSKHKAIPQQPPPPPPCISSLDSPSMNHVRDASSAAQVYWQRVRQLERELSQLAKWLNAEERLTDCLKNIGKEDTKEGIMRLVAGDYLWEVRTVRSAWGRLVMQVSSPTIAEDCVSAIEVLRGMALMDVKELHDCLAASMPMADMTGCYPGEIKRAVKLGSEDGFMESIILGEMTTIEELAMEGLRIQMGSSRMKVAKDEEKANRKCVVLVTLIQVRDPERKYEAVGEFMVGLIEASAAEVRGQKYSIEGVHVAGIKYGSERNNGNDLIWSASVEGWKGNGNCSCWKYARNPDMFFVHAS